MEEAAARGDSLVDYDSAFHVAIAHATGNGTLVELVRALNDTLRETREISFRPDARPPRPSATTPRSSPRSASGPPRRDCRDAPPPRPGRGPHPRLAARDRPDGRAARQPSSRTARSAREAEAVRHGRRLGPAAHVELGEDPRDVHAGGLLGHVELGADLAVVAPRATSARTWRSRGVRPNGSSASRPSACVRGGVARLLAPSSRSRARAKPLDLAREPPARRAAGRSRAPRPRVAGAAVSRSSAQRPRPRPRAPSAPRDPVRTLDPGPPTPAAVPQLGRWLARGRARRRPARWPATPPRRAAR